MKRESFQKASQAKLPPQPDLLGVDSIVVKNTRFSKNRTHRYTLYRHWGDQEHYCVFIGMNPSGADEAAVDRTVNRCINFAQDWGFGALYMLNAFGLRATLPTELLTSPDPVGPDNDYWIGETVQRAARVVVAWGKEGVLADEAGKSSNSCWSAAPLIASSASEEIKMDLRNTRFINLRNSRSSHTSRSRSDV